MLKTAGLIYGQGYEIGYPDWLSVTTPAAGANASVTVDGAYVLRVLAARLNLTTDANAANRFVSLDYINQRGQTFVRNAAGLVVTANTTNQKFEWICNRGDAQWAANTPVLLPCGDFYLYPGCSVQFTVDSIQATDQISGLSLYVEKFETGTMGYELGAVEEWSHTRPHATD